MTLQQYLHGNPEREMHINSIGMDTFEVAIWDENRHLAASATGGDLITAITNVEQIIIERTNAQETN